MDKFVRVSDVVDWFRAYGHMDQEIPFETLVTDLRDNSIPAADVAPVRHGRWDEHGKCIVCGGHAPFWCMASTYYTSQYCPECGAKMDGDQDG